MGIFTYWKLWIHSLPLVEVTIENSGHQNWKKYMLRVGKFLPWVDLAEYYHDGRGSSSFVEKKLKWVNTESVNSNFTGVCLLPDRIATSTLGSFASKHDFNRHRARMNYRFGESYFRYRWNLGKGTARYSGTFIFATRSQNACMAQNRNVRWDFRHPGGSLVHTHAKRSNHKTVQYHNGTCCTICGGLKFFLWLVLAITSRPTECTCLTR